MSERKSYNNCMELNRHTDDMHSRRMDEVRRNFAVGNQRAVAAKTVSRIIPAKARVKSTV